MNGYGKERGGRGKTRKKNREKRRQLKGVWDRDKNREGEEWKREGGRVWESRRKKGFVKGKGMAKDRWRRERGEKEKNQRYERDGN